MGVQDELGVVSEWEGKDNKNHEHHNLNCFIIALLFHPLYSLVLCVSSHYNLISEFLSSTKSKIKLIQEFLQLNLLKISL